MQVGEAVELPAGPDPDEPCWACEEKPKEPKVKNDLDESPSSLGPPENDLANDSSTLGKNVGFRPEWNISVARETDAAGSKIMIQCTVTPAAHHLIPGNASLKRCPSLLDLMDAGRGKITSDIGYDVNSAQNGIWLPGSYGVTEVSDFEQKWSAYSFQLEYAFAAMAAAGAQFHDAHPTYSKLLIRSLRSLADKITLKAPEKCGICGKETEDKARPPYGLVGRLNRLSSLHRRFLRGPTRKWPVATGYFTSRWAVLKATTPSPGL